jgi:hypothetical protein
MCNAIGQRIRYAVTIEMNIERAGMISSRPDRSIVASTNIERGKAIPSIVNRSCSVPAMISIPKISKPVGMGVARVRMYARVRAECMRECSPWLCGACEDVCPWVCRREWSA